MQKRATQTLIVAIDELRAETRPLDRDLTKLSEAIVRRPDLNDEPEAQHMMCDTADTVRAAVAHVQALRNSLRSLGEKADRWPS